MNILNSVYKLDGSTGALLRNNPEMSLYESHRLYIEAGADFITANTFDIDVNNLPKSTYEGRKALKTALAAVKGTTVKVLCSLGPTTKAASINTNFEDILSVYSRYIIDVFKDYHEFFLVETATDSLNIKAALVAISEIYPDSKVIVSVSVDIQGYLLDGYHFMSVHDMLLNYKNVVAFGLNCSFGPSKLIPHLKLLNERSCFPIIFYPNNGLPNAEGKYAMTVDEFLEQLNPLFTGEVKVNIIGGCCGTTPDHIKALDVKSLQHFKPIKPKAIQLAGRRQMPDIQLRIIGERLNANGSKAFRDAVINHDYFIVGEIASKQYNQRAQILDVNLDNRQIPKDDDKIAFQVIQSHPIAAELPLSIDTVNEERALYMLQHSAGRPLFNSIGFEKSIEESLSYIKKVRKLGAVPIIRAQHYEYNFGKNFEEKTRIFHSILTNIQDNLNLSYDDFVYDICIQPICLDENSDQLIRYFHALVRYIRNVAPKLKLTCGLSNVSFAFKGNTAFRRVLHQAFHRFLGLDLIIANPADFDNTTTNHVAVGAVMSLLSDCLNFKSITNELVQLASEVAPVKQEQASESLNTLESLLMARADYRIIKQLESEEHPEVPLSDSMKTIGDWYDAGKVQIIQLLTASDTLKKVLKHFSAKAVKNSFRGAFMTVEGDVHDIGKDITVQVISAQGFDIDDFGIDVPVQKAAELVLSGKYSFVGLSGLISPSLDAMKRVAQLVADSNPLHKCLLMIGGAVVYEQFADELNEVLKNTLVKAYYSKAPTGAVTILKRELLGE